MGRKLFNKTKRYFQRGFRHLLGPQRVKFKDVWPLIDKVEGLLVQGQEEWLFHMSRSLPDGARIVEIGAFKGRSTVSLAHGCSGSRKQIFSIDKFIGIYEDVQEHKELYNIFREGFFGEWRANIEKNGLSEYVTPLVGDSSEISRIWAAPINMLFIDGSHKYEDVMNDFNNFYPHVVANGIIALHDVTENWEGPTKAWNDHIKGMLKDTGVVSTIAYGRKPK